MKNIIALLLISLSISAQPKQIIDLNNDGIKEKIEVTQSKITINDKAFETYFDGTLKSYKIVDINTTDDFKEIEVFIDGPNVPDYLYYYYNKNNEIQTVGSTGITTKVLGNGIVYGTNWWGFYSQTKKYVLQRDHTLAVVPADYHFINKEYKVEKPFEIYTQYDPNSKILATIAEQSTITIIATYQDSWLMIKTSNGLLGWVKLEKAQMCLLNLVMAG